MEKAARDIAEMLAQARGTVVFTGAGMSTESGIADFRSPGGIWSRFQPVLYEDFLARAEARHEYWRQKVALHDEFAQAEPNAAHRLLADWEAAGRIAAVVTQNIDGLHQMAGSMRVLELHGSARRVRCLDCEAEYDVNAMIEYFRTHSAVPPCTACAQGRLKHATISFGQSLPQAVLDEAMGVCCAADLVLVLGSSLVVEPAASLPRMAVGQGARLAIINREATPLDATADVVLHGPLGDSLATIERWL